jgi:uncharacterized protein YggU (UPF0235/DUF167 family)
LTPGARSEVVSGVWADANGIRYLRNSIRAKPEKGKANMALVDFLADRLRCPKTKFELVSGSTSRQKILILCDPQAGKVLAALAA